MLLLSIRSVCLLLCICVHASDDRQIRWLVDQSLFKENFNQQSDFILECDLIHAAPPQSYFTIFPARMESPKPTKICALAVADATNYNSLKYTSILSKCQQNPSSAPHNPFVFGETEPSQPPATPKCLSQVHLRPRNGNFKKCPNIAVGFAVRCDCNGVTTPLL